MKCHHPGGLVAGPAGVDLAISARTIAYLPYRSAWTDKAGGELTAAVDSLTDVEFGDVNTKSSPPFHRLLLGSRAEPETDLDE